MLPRDIFSYRSQGIYFNNKGEYVMSTLIKLTLIGWLLFCLPPLQTQATADTPADCNSTSHVLPQGQWHLISLPCQPNNAGTVASVLVYEYDAQKSTHKTLKENGMLTQGKAYPNRLGIKHAISGVL